MRNLGVWVGVGLLWGAAVAGDGKTETRGVPEIAASVAGDGGSSYARAQKLVAWVNDHFEWTATDYEQRTVEQILERGGGNCAEQARLLTALLDAAEVQTRWVAEINIHPRSERRRASAQRKIAESGNKMSVFGYMHNDHRWLEVQDEATGLWHPSDPTLGVIGLDAWIDARVGFAERPEAATDMLVPFVVIVRVDGQIEDRSRHYLIDAFDARYDGKLSGLEAWAAWTRSVGELSALGAAAFAGEVNLHEHVAAMERHQAAWEALRDQYRARFEDGA